ncbi:hypothetical protein GCM10022267_10860 [Lentzea roselyniae]|uniref:Uncharacterized protein n=1 Tax=Lentzea roselyniae TaxID=531940 RepID=A0ABP7A7H9_9PSEU
MRGLKIDFMDSDGQDRYRWYDEILPETARMRFLINSTVPRCRTASTARGRTS